MKVQGISEAWMPKEAYTDVLAAVPGIFMENSLGQSHSGLNSSAKYDREYGSTNNNE